MTGRRAVLVAPRTDFGRMSSNSVHRAVERITALGYVLVSVVGLEDYRAAHRMVADNEADVIVVADPRDLPSVSLAADPRRTHPLPQQRRPGPAVPQRERRTEILRPVAEGVSTQRRPQRIDGPAGSAHGAPDFREDDEMRTPPADLPAGVERVPVRRRASQSHRSGTVRRRSRA